MWSGKQYDEVAGPQHRWGVDVIERLPSSGLARILDAGCGSGRVTEALLDRFPDAQVVGIDTSRSMLDAAARRLDRFGDRVALLEAGLHDDHAIRSLGTFDAILSTGVFHWVVDHRAMFSTLREVLCAGGVLAAQAGGEGSLREVRTILTELGVEWESLNNYANAVETCAALEAAGFVDVECWMVDEPIEYAGSSELRAFLLEGVIAPYVSGWPEAERTQLATDVANRLAAPVLHFVRLNIRAVSGPA